jgi:hypothetical protein
LLSGQQSKKKKKKKKTKKTRWAGDLPQMVVSASKCKVLSSIQYIQNQQSNPLPILSYESAQPAAYNYSYKLKGKARFFSLVGLEFELRALHLKMLCWGATPPVHFALVILEMESPIQNYLQDLALNLDPPDLSFPSS